MEGTVDRADAAFRAAMGVAARGGDLEDVLRDLLRVCGRRRDALECARDRCQAVLTDEPHDLTLLRAHELLEGALRTTLYASAVR
jgi:hypothetical protein